jgi:hypothetical protein
VEEGYQYENVLKKEMITVFIGPPRGLKKNKSSHIDKDSSPLSVMIQFVQIFSADDGTE